ncbi:L-ribulose-5-phosphate 4-epimerase AraD [candidate division KSB1 bacterium]
MSKFESIKEQAWRYNVELKNRRVVIYTFGNVSVFDRHEGVFAIKPSGVPYADMKPEDMVVVDLDNNTVEGRLRPSSDTKTHSVLYKNFQGIGGIAHTHSTYAVSWAQAKTPIPVLGTTHADLLCTEIPCTQEMGDEVIDGDYEEQTGHLIVRTLKDFSYKDTEMVLVAGHGPFTWGKTAERAVYNSVMLEELAKMAALTKMINPDTGRLNDTLIRKHFERKHGKNAYYGQKENNP